MGTVEEHYAAVAAALASKPHIVVLELAFSQGGAGWAETLREMVRSPSLSAFKGAVIVACEQDIPFAVRRLCYELWEGSSSELVQRDMPGRDKYVIEDALNAYVREPTNDNTKTRRNKKQDQAEPSLGGLVEEARAVSEYWFEEDLFKVAQKKDWTVAFLVEDDANSSFRGYIAYCFVQTPTGTAINIERVGVPRAFCRRGYGSILIQWLIDDAAQIPRSKCSAITTEALSNVVRFYKRHGFVESLNQQHDEQNDDDPNIFMERPNISRVCENDHLLVPSVTVA